MNKKKLIDKLKEFPYFRKLRFVYLYGSAAEGRTTERSDIDICLFYDIKDKKVLRRLFFRISGAFPKKFDIQMFQLLPLYVQKNVFKGRLIYTNNKDFVYDLARKTFLDYQDFEPRYKYILYSKAGIKQEVTIL